LKWTHFGDCFEVLVERRWTHVDQGGESLHIQRLVEIGSHPGHRLGNPVELAFLLADHREALAERGVQQPNQDLVHDQWGQKLGFSRL